MVVAAWVTAFVPVVVILLGWLIVHANSRGPSNYDNGNGLAFGATIYPNNSYIGQPGYTDTATSTDTPSEVPYSSPSTPDGDPTAQASTIDQALQQTATDRLSAVAAVQDIAACGAKNGLQNDVNTLQSTQRDRTSLASGLQQGSFDQLNGGARAAQLLETALQDSAASDGDYAAVGQDFVSAASCTAAAVAQDSNFTAAQNADKTATADKTDFTQAWNPLAQQYGLQTRDQSQF